MMINNLKIDAKAKRRVIIRRNKPDIPDEVLIGAEMLVIDDIYESYVVLKDLNDKLMKKASESNVSRNSFLELIPITPETIRNDDLTLFNTQKSFKKIITDEMDEVFGKHVENMLRYNKNQLIYENSENNLSIKANGNDTGGLTEDEIIIKKDEPLVEGDESKLLNKIETLEENEKNERSDQKRSKQNIKLLNAIKTYISATTLNKSIDKSIKDIDDKKDVNIIKDNNKEISDKVDLIETHGSLNENDLKKLKDLSKKIDENTQLELMKLKRTKEFQELLKKGRNVTNIDKNGTVNIDDDILNINPTTKEDFKKIIDRIKKDLDNFNNTEKENKIINQLIRKLNDVSFVKIDKDFKTAIINSIGTYQGSLNSLKTLTKEGIKKLQKESQKPLLEQSKLNRITILLVSGISATVSMFLSWFTPSVVFGGWVLSSMLSVLGYNNVTGMAVGASFSLLKYLITTPIVIVGLGVLSLSDLLAAYVGIYERPIQSKVIQFMWRITKSATKKTYNSKTFQNAKNNFFGFIKKKARKFSELAEGFLAEVSWNRPTKKKKLNGETINAYLNRKIYKGFKLSSLINIEISQPMNNQRRRLVRVKTFVPKVQPRIMPRNEPAYWPMGLPYNRNKRYRIWPPVGYKKTIVCRNNFDPVCGVNGKTYRNKCYAYAKGVRIKRKGRCRPFPFPNQRPQAIPWWFLGVWEGKIPTKKPNYLPDDVNWNVLRRQIKPPPKPPRWWRKNKSWPPRKRPNVCPLIWNPVCGMDNKTYGNACEARRNGVIVKRKGRCNQRINESYRFFVPLNPPRFKPRDYNNWYPIPYLEPIQWPPIQWPPPYIQQLLNNGLMKRTRRGYVIQWNRQLKPPMFQQDSFFDVFTESNIKFHQLDIGNNMVKLSELTFFDVFKDVSDPIDAILIERNGQVNRGRRRTNQSNNRRFTRTGPGRRPGTRRNRQIPGVRTIKRRKTIPRAKTTKRGNPKGRRSPSLPWFWDRRVPYRGVIPGTKPRWFRGSQLEWSRLSLRRPKVRPRWYRGTWGRPILPRKPRWWPPHIRWRGVIPRYRPVWWPYEFWPPPLINPGSNPLWLLMLLVFWRRFVSQKINMNINSNLMLLPKKKEIKVFVTDQPKSKDHPWYGLGSEYGYAINGKEGIKLQLKRGIKYIFKMNNVNEKFPFYLANHTTEGRKGKYVDPYLGFEVSDRYVTGDSEIVFEPNMYTPNYLFYQCKNYPYMGGRIKIVD